MQVTLEINGYPTLGKLLVAQILLQRLGRVVSHVVTCIVGMQLIHLCALTSAAQLQPGQQPELFVQSGHTAVTVSAVAFSSNLQWLVSGGSDGQIILWNVPMG